jgi:hypothetical protein
MVFGQTSKIQWPVPSATQGRTFSPPSEELSGRRQLRESCSCSCLSRPQRFVFVCSGAPVDTLVFLVDTAPRLLTADKLFDASQLSPRHQSQSTVSSSQAVDDPTKLHTVADVAEVDLYGEISEDIPSPTPNKSRGTFHYERRKQGGDQESLPQGSCSLHPTLCYTNSRERLH